MVSWNKLKFDRFVVDVMLGKLARWLRFLGYDTLYDNNADDDELLYTALREDRLLITRDTGLAERGKEHALLLYSSNFDVQLRELAEQVELSTDLRLTRCPKCNAELKGISKALVANKVGEHTYKTHELFLVCPRCGKIYWHGSHMKHIKARLARILRPDEETG